MIMAAGLGKRMHHDLHGNLAGIAGAFAVHGEGERGDGLVSNLALDPLRAVGAVGHLAFPDAAHLFLHAIGRDAVHEAPAAAAAFEREHQPGQSGRVQRRPGDQRRQLAAERDELLGQDVHAGGLRHREGLRRVVERADHPHALAVVAAAGGLEHAREAELLDLPVIRLAPGVPDAPPLPVQP